MKSINQKGGYCCRPIDEELEEDLFWHSMHKSLPLGDIYIPPYSMRYIFPEDGVSVYALRDSISRCEKWSDRDQRDYMTMYAPKRRKKVDVSTDNS